MSKLGNFLYNYFGYSIWPSLGTLKKKNDIFNIHQLTFKSACGRLSVKKSPVFYGVPSVREEGAVLHCDCRSCI